MSNIRSILVALLVGVLIILGTSVYLYLTSPEITEADSLVGEGFREFVLPTGFLHTEGNAITLGQYVGSRVILLEFMRYGCPNCQRSFPHIVSLHERFKDRGLTVIGVHTPQFPHEGVEENIQKAMEAAGVTFPIVIDNAYGTWNAYENRYWPRTILINTEGVIVYDAIGSEDIAVLEATIETLLSE
jgi:peroxiredoxin